MATEFWMYLSWNEYVNFDVYVLWESLDEGLTSATEDLDEALDSVRRGVDKERQK
jgi:hypothetical protein